MKLETWKVIQITNEYYEPITAVVTENAVWNETEEQVEKGWRICSVNEIPNKETYAKAISLVPEMLATLHQISLRCKDVEHKLLAQKILQKLIS